uniref:CDP-diacylglycerol--glycerol-3-phosphate 3-phosphatidyltransferase n=1 Tax=OCS116 cluster bacterium TaxID=2030921 RepID=A0A2A4YW43_9PROT
MVKKDLTIFNLPNVITIARIASVPVIIWFLFVGEFLSGFILFSIAGFSDFIDGWLARFQKTQTTFGAYLDPIADKLLMGSAYISLGLLGHIPLWLILLVIARDLLILLGVVAAWLMGRTLDIKPLLISKLNTALQICLVMLVLADLAFRLELGAMLDLAYLATAATTIASALAYLYLWVTTMLKQSSD